jgi:uncharacterized protein with GYD domain
MTMATYVLLSTLTDDGAKTITQKPERIREVSAEVEKMGVKVKAQYALLGPYDFLTIVEADDNEAVASLSAHLGARGSVKIMTLAAMPVDALIGRLK